MRFQRNPTMNQFPFPETMRPHFQQFPNTIPAQRVTLQAQRFTLPAQKQTLPPAQKQFLPVPVLPEPPSGPQPNQPHPWFERSMNPRASNGGGGGGHGGGGHGGGGWHGGGGRWRGGWGGGWGGWYPYYSYPYYGYGAYPYGYGAYPYNYGYQARPVERIVCERIAGSRECPDGTIVRRNRDGSKTCCPPDSRATLQLNPGRPRFVTSPVTRYPAPSPSPRGYDFCYWTGGGPGKGDFCCTEDATGKKVCLSDAKPR